jgi:maltooligosyltrehalose trehalohydrolase
MHDQNNPAVGAFYNNGITNFILWASGQKKVSLEVNGKLHCMHSDHTGYWYASIEEAPPGTRYHYRLDNGKLLPDPSSRWQPEGVHGPSAVIDPEFEWSDTNWKGMSLSDMVIYELHTGTFTADGTFMGVIEKLPYLQSLGVNAIELMPVAQFPGGRNWGYDGVFPFAVQESYGGVTGLKQLVNEAHRHQIAIILDVVYNHLGPEGNYFAEFAPYFTDKYKTGWGKAVNFDDAWSDGVRHYFWQNACMWLDEFRIDGLRLDAVHAIWDSGAKHFIAELSDRVKQLEVSSGRKKILIAEFDLNNPRYISPAEKGGYGLNGQWVDEFHHALHSVTTGEVDGYYEDFGTIQHLAKAYQDGYVYTGQYSVHRKKKFGALPRENTYDQFIVFAQNHDQIGNRMLGDRLTKHLSYEALKVTAAAFLLSSCVPMLFMGEEYGEENPFMYFISHSDEELIKSIRKGRKEEFSYFKWEGELPDPFAEETFNACKLSWKFEHDERAANLLAYYRHLISLRKKRPVFKNTARSGTEVLTFGDQRVLAFTKNGEGESLLIVLNFEQKEFSWNFSISNLTKIFDSSAQEWMGNGAVTARHVAAGQSFAVNPESVVVFELIA